MLNPLNVFLHPENTVKEFIEKPNLAFALVLVLLPSILLLAVLAATGFNFVGIAWLILLVKDVVLWVIFGVAIFVLVFLIKGWQVEKKFIGILTAYSLVSFIKLILVAIFVISVMIFAPNYFQVVSGLSAQPELTYEEMMAGFSSMEVAELGGNIIFAHAMTVISIILLIYLFYIIYKIIKVSVPSTFKKNVIVFILMLVFFYIVSFFL